jgi:hypothetical protein
MLHHAISHERLMRKSTERVQAALDSADTGEQTIARRVFENPDAWGLWEREHSNLMRRIADSSARMQVAALKHTNFRLLHGTALFQYLKQGAVRGAQRQRVLAHFRPGRSYEAALISEHAAYTRKACSFLCTTHLGSEVVRDAAFLDPMTRYEELYAEYFDLYCTTLIAPSPETETRLALLPLLKHQLHEYRVAILDPRAAQSFLRREAELRRSAGDTQRLKTLGTRTR